jgi:hypothetical protein
MALLLAIVTCGVFSIFSFSFRHYQSWYSWGRLPTNSLMILYITLAACGGGAIGWAIASLAHATPTATPELNGVLFGLGGVAALRTNWKSEKTSNRTLHRTQAQAQLQDASTLLAKTVAWTATALDETAHRRMTAWLKSLPNDDLMEVGWDVQADIAKQTGISGAVKRQLLAGLVPQMEQLAKLENIKAARAHLVSFCAMYFVQEHWPKPHRASTSVALRPHS